MHVQLRARLAGSTDEHAISAVEEAHRWISDARSKVAWCAETDSAVDCDSIEARVSTIADLCSSMSDGELLRDTALRRAQNAVHAAAESDDSHWSNCCRQLNDDWMKFTAELQDTR